MNEPTQHPTTLDSTFDHALRCAAEKLRGAATFSPFLVQRFANSPDSYSITEVPNADPDQALSFFRSLPTESSLVAYAIVFDGRITLQETTTDAIVVEGIDSEGFAPAQTWAVPYERPEGSTEPEPRGLYRIADTASRFAIAKPAPASTAVSQPTPGASRLKLPVCWSSSAIEQYAPLHDRTPRYTDLIRRMTGHTGKVAIGLTLDELPQVLSGAQVPSNLIDHMLKVVEFVRSSRCGAPGPLGRAANGLTRHPQHRPVLFPDTILCCAERSTKLFTPRGEAQLYIDPLNYFVQPVLPDTAVPTSAPTSVPGTPLTRTGLNAVRFLFLPFPPDTTGLEIFRWFVDFYCELSTAISLDILSFWMKVHCNYHLSLTDHSGKGSSTYSNSLFSIATRTSQDNATIDQGLYELLMAGTRARTEREVTDLLRGRAESMKLFNDRELSEAFSRSSPSRYLSMDHAFLISRYGATLDNLETACEEMIDYLVQSVDECVNHTKALKTPKNIDNNVAGSQRRSA